MRRYEALFLFDNNVAYEWPSVEKEVGRLCQRIGAEVLACVKFDERKLSYEIRGRKRGTYVLTYLEAPPAKITELEHDAGLSESVLRLLVLRNDDITQQRIDELKAWPADKPLVPLQEQRRDDRDRDGRDRDGRRDDYRDGGRRDDYRRRDRDDDGRDGGRDEGRGGRDGGDDDGRGGGDE